MDEPTSSSPKLDFSVELKEALKRNLELEAKFEASEGRNKSKDTQLSELRKKLGAASEPKPDIEPAAPVKKEPEAPKEPEPQEKPKVIEHSMSITDAFCPECKEANPEFKDETECADCGHPLGAIATLDRVKACPGCGHTTSENRPDHKLAIKRQKKSKAFDLGETLGIKA